MTFNLSVGRRLALGFGGLVVLSLILAVQSLTEFKAAGKRLHDIVEVNNPKSDLANQLLNEINTLAIQSRSITLLTDVKEIDDEVCWSNRERKRRWRPSWKWTRAGRART